MARSLRVNTTTEPRPAISTGSTRPQLAAILPLPLKRRPDHMIHYSEDIILATNAAWPRQKL